MARAEALLHVVCMASVANSAGLVAALWYANLLFEPLTQQCLSQVSLATQPTLETSVEQSCWFLWVAVWEEGVHAGTGVYKVQTTSLPH